MKITNKLGLPEPFVLMAQSDYRYKEGRYSVTALLKGVREMLLERRHTDEVEQDVSDMIWMLFGTAVHGVLECQPEQSHELKEVDLCERVHGREVSGRFDLYNSETMTIEDYKVTSVWKVLFGDFADYRRQLVTYAYLLEMAGFPVKRGRVVMILKDHNKRKAKTEAGYPPLPVHVVTFDFTDEDKQEARRWIEFRIDEIKASEALPDDRLPLCTSEERWAKPAKWAVMKGKNKRAMRLLDSEEEAVQWMYDKGGDRVEYRAGEDTKCAEYCRVNGFCTYWQEKERELQNGADTEIDG